MKKTLIALIGLLPLTSCWVDNGCLESEGETITEQRYESEFNSVDIELSADVYLRQGAVSMIEIEATDNILSKIRTNVRGGELEIDFKNSVCIRNSGSVKIYITNPEYRAIALSGSGQIINTSAIVEDDLKITLDGSGDIELTNLDVHDLDVELSGSGEIYLQGESMVDKADIEVSGSGEIDAYNLTIANVDVEISGSGEIDLYATERVDAKISGSGNIDIYGDAAVDQDVTGSGNISIK